jgi:hypothetical protein
MKEARAIIVLILSVILSSTCAHMKSIGAKDPEEKHYEKRPIPSTPSITLQLS